MFRIVGGNDRLAAAMAKGLGKDAIILQREVVAITQTEERRAVSVLPTACSKPTTSIVTAPATAVRRIRFEPALPPEQHRAIDTLPYGQATKTLLQCTRPFWRTADRASRLRHEPRRRRALGRLGRSARTRGDPRVARGRLGERAGPGAAARRKDRKASSSAFAGCAPRQKASRGEGSVESRTVIASHSTTWEDDRWAGGGYAYFSSSFDPSLRRWLSAPAGRILFAGEHTSLEWQGYMNGALTTGQRAAMEVLALAGRLP